MSTWRKGLCCGVLFVCALAGSTPAADKANPNVKVEGINLGQSIMGPKVSAEDFKGKVVMVEFWGIN